MPASDTEICNLCDGSGLRVIEREDGTRFAEPCACRSARKMARQLGQARIPERYQHCTLEDYFPNYGGNNASLNAALVQARNFVKAYPWQTDGKGLLLTGSLGVGKTHLAVGILRELVAEKQARGLFVDYRDLLKQVQHSYNRSVETTELDVLRPVFEAEVLVLDELGASQPTEWVWDTVAHILNTRYNERLTTIITTNYPNLPAGALAAGTARGTSEQARMLQEVTRSKTLGDRIGDRMLSRLQEMCVVVDMAGDDFRQTVKRARFG